MQFLLEVGLRFSSCNLRAFEYFSKIKSWIPVRTHFDHHRHGAPAAGDALQ
jgi:hypothetical protein